MIQGEKVLWLPNKASSGPWGAETREEEGLRRVGSFLCLILKEIVPMPRADPGIFSGFINYVPRGGLQRVRSVQGLLLRQPFMFLVLSFSCSAV